MIMKKVTWQMLSSSEVCRIANIERELSRSMPDLHRLEEEWERLDCFVFSEGERIVGYVLMEPACAWFPGSIRMVKMRYCWEYNREDVICEMIRSAAAAYPSAQLVCLDSQKRRDLNYGVYRKLGFQESPMRSPCGQDHSVLIAAMETLKAPMHAR